MKGGRDNEGMDTNGILDKVKMGQPQKERVKEMNNRDEIEEREEGEGKSERQNKE